MMETRPMAWIMEWARRTVANVVATRPVPAHIAFIMDGNRRFAERQNLKVLQGHTFGYQRLIQALEWCLDLGIMCVSVYAFSIDNYNRSPEEVATLMALAEDKLSQMLEEQDVLHKHSVQVRVIGDLAVAPPSVRSAAESIMAATRHHTRAILNICFCYTSSRELQQALDSAAAANSINGTYSTLDEHLYTRDCPPVDLLVRTSGEFRLSDFMLRQSSHALLVFSRALWPEYSFMDLIAAILQYQRCAKDLEAARQASAAAAAGALDDLRIRAAELATIGPQQQQYAGDDEEEEYLRVVQGVSSLKMSTLESAGSPCGVATPGSPSSPSSRSAASSDRATSFEDLLLAESMQLRPGMRLRAARCGIQETP